VKLIWLKARPLPSAEDRSWLAIATAHRQIFIPQKRGPSITPVKGPWWMRDGDRTEKEKGE